MSAIHKRLTALENKCYELAKVVNDYRDYNYIKKVIESLRNDINQLNQIIENLNQSNDVMNDQLMIAQGKSIYYEQQCHLLHNKFKALQTLAAHTSVYLPALSDLDLTHVEIFVNTGHQGFYEYSDFMQELRLLNMLSGIKHNHQFKYFTVK